MSHLPPGSHYVAAQRNDPEYADHAVALLDGLDEEPQWSPPAEGWAIEREQLAQIIDLLGDLITVTINCAPNDTSVDPPPRFPRPETEIERARRRATVREFDALDALVEQAHATWAAENGTPSGSN